MYPNLSPASGPAFTVAIAPGQIAGWLFAIVVFFWIIYTLVAIYHWIRFSHASLVAIPSIGIHLFVSAVLILFAASGLI